jgi:hypothetical protein
VCSLPRQGSCSGAKGPAAPQTGTASFSSGEILTRRPLLTGPGGQLREHRPPLLARPSSRTLQRAKVKAQVSILSHPLRHPSDSPIEPIIHNRRFASIRRPFSQRSVLIDGAWRLRPRANLEPNPLSSGSDISTTSDTRCPASCATTGFCLCDNRNSSDSASVLFLHPGSYRHVWPVVRQAGLAGQLQQPWSCQD